MTLHLSRDANRLDIGRGLLHCEHFQMAYGTNDIERARDLLSARLGIGAFRRLEGPLAQGGHIRADLAWVGTIMYELIEATGPGSEIYQHGRPAGEGFRLWHHHLGFLVPDEAQWERIFIQAEHNGWQVPYRSRNTLLQACFVDVPELGHYLEYLFPEPAGTAFFENVPRS